ncbi:hypothetical protein FRZ67_05195 [Panacibacter ginsenosidivorans]|uniref:Uncharacterized protein n=1 Tax=Panacibacter ginsenosidivorans TaxID=1813871 RepID=A0A5B8V7P9_9BACT|nr:putative zinc-binding metallopeptidase [Panacibacter ginsenosidivorans]QEC66726.1 hypothetical protein FRZ67_05195 [Panacibacter ginsenosidivorans]
MSVHPQAADTKTLHAEIKKDPYAIEGFEAIMELWLPLPFAMNSLKRSMGLKDIYPFVITAAVKEKMKFIHKIVISHSQQKNK